MATNSRFIAKNGLDNNGKTITNVADPVNASDVATRSFVLSNSSSLTVSDDVSTNTSFYPTFVSSTSGSISSEKVSSTKLTFNPGTGILYSNLLYSSRINISNSATYVGMSIDNTYGSASLSSTCYVDFRNELGISKTHIFSQNNTDGSSTLHLGTTASGVARNTDSRTTIASFHTTGSTIFSGLTTSGNITVNGGTVTATNFSGTATWLSGSAQVNKITGATLSMSMSQDSGATQGSFVCRASGTGDANLAGMTFYNDSYALKLGIRADGYFGLGGWSRPGWSWYSDPSGNMVAAGNVTAYSDPRLKENFQKIENPLQILSNLDGGTFIWKDGYAHTAIKAGKKDYGVLADQVEAVMPEIVTESIEIEGERYKTVAYEKLVPVLIEAIKQLENRILELENKG